MLLSMQGEFPVVVMLGLIKNFLNRLHVMTKLKNLGKLICFWVNFLSKLHQN